MNVAVVGGGIFGTTAAIELARHGHSVDLYEREGDLLCAASGINQYRLHRGYHYPRSLETAIASRDAEKSFRASYPDAVIDDNAHYYAIANKGSQTSACDFLGFLSAARLEHEQQELSCLCGEQVDLVVRVRESLFDPERLRAIVWERLRALQVRVHLGVSVQPDALTKHDHIVLATYASLGGMVSDEGASNYQFEVCEKPVVRLPETLARTSIVIMDGPFMCVDPLGRTGLAVMGNVVHALHHTNVGRTPEVPDALVGMLNRGIVRKPSVTRFQDFIESASRFIPTIRSAEHIGSMFTVRAVLPGLDDTDARPTLVVKRSERVFTLFSGKIGTCVRAAEELVSMIGRTSGRQPPQGDVRSVG
ncbi:MAG: FAD-dependent oxidoreductase [Deltaproteobacteria bacterium]|nr:FAD-dependent oxidoreductase [Deltaproteobacteria bacterium]